MARLCFEPPTGCSTYPVDPSEPTTDPVSVSLIFMTKHGAQPLFLDRDYHPVHVGNYQRQQNNGHDLVENGSLSDIRERETHVHWIPGPSIWTPGYEGGGSLAWDPGCSCAVKDDPAPRGKRCAKRENNGAHGGQQLVVPDESS